MERVETVLIIILQIHRIYTFQEEKEHGTTIERLLFILGKKQIIY
jgi:hypothetical protein